ncbi:MAG: isocitrate/isopropylmalate family dehydrogenase, partial [Acetobacteraceae bacterium]
MTWSIVAHDPATGAFAVAVTTCNIAVGATCPFLKSGGGAVSTQSMSNRYLGPAVLQGLERGLTPAKAIEAALVGDEGKGLRQVHAVDCHGRNAAWTGENCVEWCGHLSGDGFSVAGNMLAGGAVGAPDIPDHVTLWELRLAICQGFDQYANVRPTRLLPGIKGPLRPDLGEQIDWVIVRENSEGEYAGVGGRAHRGLPIEVAMDVAVFTREGVARICRHACEVAMARPRKHLTVVTKSNAQRHGMVMWDEVCAEITAQYPALTVEKMLVDAMTA